MKMIFGWTIAILLVVVVSGYALIIWLWGGADHSQYDAPRPELVKEATSASEAHLQIAKAIADERTNAPKMSQAEMLELMREQMDQRGLAFDIAATISPVSHNGVVGEWVIAPNADPRRRLLYIHGGAYMVGSPQSHRRITSELSKRFGMAVFAVQYRLMPEHARMDGIHDVRGAYRWILNNGPDGETQAKRLVIAGDSSGGNLALSTIAWARDEGIRSADAALVFSPQTDLTLSGPSLVSNIATDVMQGDSFGPVVKAPKGLRLLFSFGMHKVPPSDPVVSPLLGDLSNLPPTLIQVSSAEMFFDDAVRYANKATAQGSEVVLQVWPHLMHVWQAFDVPEADEAFEKIAKFGKEFVPD